MNDEERRRLRVYDCKLDTCEASGKGVSFLGPSSKHEKGAYLSSSASFSSGWPVSIVCMRMT